MEFLTFEEVVSAHDANIARFGGEPGLPRPGYVDAALERCQWGPFEQETLYERAALLMRGLCKDHPFADGNKRISFIATDAFLQKNGERITTTNDDVVSFMLALAADDQEAYPIEVIAEWIRARAEKL